MVYLIGCGGAGAWLAPGLLKLKQEPVMVDGDVIELRNLDRQLFTKEDVGRNKAEALAAGRCEHIASYYYNGLIEHFSSDLLMVAVDNNPARLEVIQACNSSGCSAIFCANEEYSAEALYYQSDWSRNPILDPTLYLPEWLEDKSGDPRQQAMGCTGEAQEIRPQLATANAMAASLALHLFVIWRKVAPVLDRQFRDCLPYRIVMNQTSCEMHRVDQKKVKA